jgi:nucleoside-diphosphate-sugar epimerase
MNIILFGATGYIGSHVLEQPSSSSTIYHHQLMMSDTSDRGWHKHSEHPSLLIELIRLKSCFHLFGRLASGPAMTMAF